MLPGVFQDIEAVVIPDVLAVYLILQDAVLKQGEMRMGMQIFDIFLQAHIQIMHEGGIALAHIPVQVQLDGYAGFLALVLRRGQRPSGQREPEDQAVLPAVLVHPGGLFRGGILGAADFGIVSVIQPEREGKAAVEFAGAGEIDFLLDGSDRLAQLINELGIDSVLQSLPPNY